MCRKQPTTLDSIAVSVFADIFIELTNTVYSIRRQDPNNYSDTETRCLVSTLLPPATLVPHQANLRAETWRCMEELQEQGVLRSIGVSNYDSTLLYEVVLLGGTRPQVTSLICRWWFP